MKIAVAIATTGRPAILAQMLLRLRRQTRAPDRVLVIGAAAADFPDAAELAQDFRKGYPGVDFVLAAKGSSKQRNRALDLIGAHCDVVIFFDDDFVPAEDFLAGAERLMQEHPEIAAASGHLLADGARSPGLSFEAADRLIAAYEADASEGHADRLHDQPGAYGCNMIVRIAALSGARFDENLPLYGWLEDLDLSARLAKAGRVVETGGCIGVHLGAKSGRSPGLQLGYSHIANPLYLAGQGAISWRRAVIMAGRVLIANSIRSLAPEPYIDRRGRLAGNLRALGDLCAGRLHPLRVLELVHEPEAKSQAGHSLS
jgi:GT2 family glycosyltransferase